MKILHVCRTFLPEIGGIQSFVYELARRAETVGDDASVLCYDHARGHAGRLPRTGSVGGVRVVRVRSAPFEPYRAAWFPLDELRAADVVHVHGIGAPLDFVAITKPLHRRPIVVSTHGGIFHTGRLGGVKRAYVDHVLPLLAGRVARFAASSKSDARTFAAAAPGKVAVVENGVDLPPVPDVPKVRGRVVYVGRLSPHKRADDLVRAAGAARRLGADVGLRLVGPDPDRAGPALLALAADHGVAGRVTVTGEVSREQLFAEMAAAEFFASASTFEGFGLSLVEAMHCRCVPVVNRIPAFVDMIADGVDGFVADFADPDAGGRLLARLVARDDLGPVAAAARDKAQAFSWDRKIVEFHRLYADVVNER